MSDNELEYNPGDFGTRIKKLFENFDMEDEDVVDDTLDDESALDGDHVEGAEEAGVDEETEDAEHDDLEQIKDVAEDIQDAVAKIKTAEELEDDGVIDYDKHQEMEADAAEDLAVAAEDLAAASEDYQETEAEEDAQIADAEGAGEEITSDDDESAEEEVEDEEEMDEQITGIRGTTGPKLGAPSGPKLPDAPKLGGKSPKFGEPTKSELELKQKDAANKPHSSIFEEGEKKDVSSLKNFIQD